MQVSRSAFFFNFLIVCLLFYLYVIIISIFGFIFIYTIKKINKEEWNLNFLEIFVVSFAIGLSIYISYCFILDIFKFFNFISAYYSIVVIDVLFVWYLIYRGDLSKGKVLDFFHLIKQKIRKNPKKTLSLIVILILALCWQIWVQWELITAEYAIPSKDTYVWLGQSWYLLEKGYLLREHLPLHYPKGFTFFLAAPELVYSDWSTAYFYMKFAGIPFFSLYIFVVFLVLKRIFEENYLIYLGLAFTIMSNFLYSRFISFVSSSIATLLILISLLILDSKAPFYLIAFIISSIFLFNAIFALFYVIAIGLLLIIKINPLNETYRLFIINYVGKTLVILIILLFPYIIHAMIVKNVGLIDILIAYFIEFGYPEATLSHTIKSVNSGHFLLQFRYILRDFFPHNDCVSQFLDIERKILSYFFLFVMISLFLPTKKFFNGKCRDIINFGKFSVLIVIAFYVTEIIFEDSANVFAQSIPWFKWRALEALSGPMIILTCFTIEGIINRAKLLTSFLTKYSKNYRNLMKNNHISKFFRLENILIALLLGSSISTIFTNQRIYTSYYFEQEHMEAIFYIKENVPENSKILVSDFDHTTNSFYDLLSTYKVYIWDFEFSENSFNETIDYIIEKDIEYILLDDTTVNSTERSIIKNYFYFEELYENDICIIFEVEIDT